MHFYFMIRGLKQQCDLFRMFMQTQMFCWKRKNLDTRKDKVTLIQGSLRECGFVYEYVFPEECFDEVMTMLNIKGIGDTIGKTREAMIRKALGKGVKPVPDYKEVPRKWALIDGIYLCTQRYIERNGVAIYPIGIKKDIRKDYDWSKTGEGRYNQEGL